MKVLLIGKNGQLGKTLRAFAPDSYGRESIELISLSRQDLDLFQTESCEKIIYQIKPDFLINVAAYTAVDLAESNSDYSFAINANAPKAFAEVLRRIGGRLIHFSTDYVFDGESNQPYKPYDKKKPINMYGKSKSLGEDYLLEILEPLQRCFIIRTSWLISHYQNNFMTNMLKLLSEKQTINVVSDQIASPTSTISLAKACWSLISNIHIGNTSPSILHLTDNGLASWYDLAKGISEYGKEFGLLTNPAIIKPIKTDEYPLAARRPFYSVLDNTKSYKSIGYESLYWRYSLKTLIEKISI